MGKCKLTDDEIKALFDEGLTFDEFRERMGCSVVRPGSIVTADYRPEARDRFFVTIKDGVVVGGSFR